MSDSPETSETGTQDPSETSERLSPQAEASMQGVEAEPQEELPQNPYDPAQFDASQISSEDVEYFSECRRISNLPIDEQWPEWEKLTGTMSANDRSRRSPYSGVDGDGVYIFPPWGNDVFRIHRPDKTRNLDDLIRDN